VAAALTSSSAAGRRVSSSPRNRDPFLEGRALVLGQARGHELEDLPDKAGQLAGHSHGDLIKTRGLSPEMGYERTTFGQGGFAIKR